MDEKIPAQWNDILASWDFQAQTTLTTNDIVISKLTQILSYLRQGTRNKKLKKKDKGNLEGQGENPFPWRGI